MSKLEIHSVQFIKSAVKPRDFIHDGRPQIAFCGRSNVGKSTLINTLVNRKQMARASSTPGRTREVNYFLINDAFYFVDLPGYGYAKVPHALRDAWRPMIEEYIRGNESLRGMILIIDVRRTPGEQDLQLAAWLEEEGRPYLPVLTKRDKVSNNELQVQMRQARKKLGLHPEEAVLTFSALTKQGRDDILAMIRELLDEEDEEESES